MESTQVKKLPYFFGLRNFRILGAKAKEIETLRESAFIKFLSYQIIKAEKNQNFGVILDGKVWIYCPATELAEKLYCSERTIRSLIKKLCNKGVIIKNKLSSNPMCQTNYYTFSDGFLKALGVSPIVQNLQGEYITTYQINKSNKSIKSDYYYTNKKQQQKDGDGSQVHTQTTDNGEACTDERPTIVQDMLKIWNDTLKMNEIADKKLAANLVACYKQKFKALDTFKLFCEAISRSQYLTAPGFKLWIRWATRFDVINRIFNGEFGVDSSELKKQCIDPAEPDDIALVRALGKKMGKNFGNYTQDVSSESLKQFLNDLREIVGADVYNQTRAELQGVPFTCVNKVNEQIKPEAQKVHQNNDDVYFVNGEEFTTMLGKWLKRRK